MLGNTDYQAWGFILLFLSFCVFILALLAWGRLLARSEGLAHWIIYGSVFAVLLPQILSYLGLLNQSWPPILFCLSALTWIPKLRQIKPPRFPSQSQERILLLSLALLMLCRFFESSLLQPHGDPLYYDLLAVAKWRNLGHIDFLPELPLLFQASWWDYIYFWPAMFFLAKPNQGLMETQIFSQWLHFFVAFGGSLWIWNYFLRNSKFSSTAKLVSTLALASTASLWWTASLAKNDWGAIFFLIAGLSLYLDGRVLFSGFLLGLAFASKWTTLPLMLPLIPALGLTDLKKSPRLIGGFAFAVFPIVLRNLLATSDPFFPVPFGGLGKEYFSQSFLDFMSQYSPSLLRRDWVQVLKTRALIFSEGPFIAIGALALLLRYRKSKNFDLASKLFLLCLGGFFLFIFLSGPHAENRLYGPGLVLMAATGALLITSLAGPRLAWAIIVLTLVFSRIPTHMILKFFKDFPPSAIAQTAGDLKEQVREKIPNTARIATSGDNELYYLSSYEVSDVLNNPALDSAVRTAGNIPNALEAIHKQGYRYLLHTTRWDGGCWPGFCEKLQAELPLYERLAVLRGKTGVLLDLDRLSQP